MLNSGNAGKPDYLDKADAASDTISIYRESIQEFRSKYWTIRVWREITETELVLSKQDDDVSEAIKTCEEQRFDQIAARILVLPKVNAVEVKDRAGNGTVIYSGWP